MQSSTAVAPQQPMLRLQQRRKPENVGHLECIGTLEGHTEAVWSVAWSPNGQYLASCGGDKTIRVWGEASGSGVGGGSGQHGKGAGKNSATRCWQCLASLEEGQERTIRNLAWSPCGRYIASVSFDATCTIWEHVTKAGGPASMVPLSQKRHQRHNWDEYDDFDDVVDSPGTSGERVNQSPSSSDSSCVNAMVWELAAQLEGHENEVKSVCWSRDGSFLATCGRDKSVWIWEIVDLKESEFECLAVLLEHTQDVKSLRFHPSRPGLLVSASYDDSLKVWAEDGDDWYCAQTLVAHSSTVWGLSFGALKIAEDASAPPEPSSSSSSASASASASFWSIVSGGATAAPTKPTASSETPVRRADYGVAFVSVSDDCSMILWRQKNAQEGQRGDGEVAGWEPVQVLPAAHERAIYSVDWSYTPGLSGDTNGQGGGGDDDEQEEEEEAERAVADHGAVATGGADDCIRIFRDWGRVVQERPLLRSRPLNGVAPKEDASAAMAVDEEGEGASKSGAGGGAGHDAPFLFLDVEVPKAHDGDVNCVAWNPTRPSILASAGDDFTVKLWRYDPYY